MQVKFTLEILKKLHLFLKNSVEKKSFNKVVVGLSGGIDSAVVAVLCRQVFHHNLLAVCMPSSLSDPTHLKDAKELCKQFDIPYIVDSIAPYEQIFQIKKSSQLRMGNFLARIRMSLLYDYSMQNNALVIGTSNKSELMLGYGTLYGDLACAINPIGNFYKTQIFALADILKLPKNIIIKLPSADLYPKQSDVLELGYSYEEIDPLLEVIDNSFPDFEEIDPKKLIAQGFDTKLVNSVIKRIKDNLFKQQTPQIYKGN